MINIVLTRKNSNDYGTIKAIIESVRFLANSNIDDGFYLQSGTDGKPLFEVVVNFKEMVGMPFIPDEFDKGATESYE